MMNIEVLFEDEALWVVNKPAGVVVNKAESVTESTVQDWAEERLGDKAEVLDTWERVFWERGGVAHRLDKDTSGVLLIAKTPMALAELMRQFKAREVRKTYTALVHGWLELEEGWVRVPIKRKGVRERKFGIDPLGKMAETHYRLHTRYESGEGERHDTYSLVRLWPKTGRTHQIRVQMAFIRHPVVGDKLYATKKQQEADVALTRRHLLHAAQIRFTHPTRGDEVVVKAAVPPEFEAVLATLAETV